MDSIYEYLDYRDFLHDHYKEQKEKNPIFSFRYVAGKTGLDASFYVKLINKQRHINDNRIKPLCVFCKLRQRESDYFKTLVNFNKAKRKEQEEYYFEKLVTLKKSAAKKIDRYAYRYFTEWYNVPLRELLNIYDFDGSDYKGLALMLSPPIKESEARRAVRTLLELGMIAPDKNGFYRPADAAISTGKGWKSEIVRSFQKSMIRLSESALDRIDPELRDISTLTVSTSPACLQKMRERLSQVRKELIEMITSDEASAVYQINMQIFPLSRIEDS